MQVIVIGYGSLLRQDDGVGQLLAEALAARLPSIEAITCTQLTIELAESLSRANRAFFIDACVGAPPGAVARQEVQPQPANGSFSHDVTPGTLLQTAADLYGSAPPATLITIAAASFELSTELSPQLQQALPTLIDTVCAWIAAA